MKYALVLSRVLLCFLLMTFCTIAQADYRVGDIVQLRAAGSDWSVDKSFISKVVKAYSESWGEKKYVVQHLQLPRNSVGAIRQSGGLPEGMRPYSGPYTNDYDPARYMGIWRLGAETSVTSDRLILKEKSFEWRLAAGQVIRGSWIANNDPNEPDRVLILKNAWQGNDWYVYPYAKKDGRLQLGVQNIATGSRYGGTRLDAEPAPKIFYAPSGNNSSVPVAPPVPPTIQPPQPVSPGAVDIAGLIKDAKATRTQLASLLTTAQQENEKRRRQIEVLRELQADKGADQNAVQKLLTYVEGQREKIKQVIAEIHQKDDELRSLIETARNTPAPVAPAQPVAPSPVPPPSYIPVAPSPAPPVPAPPVPVAPVAPAKTFQVGQAVEVFQGVGWRIGSIREIGAQGYKVDYGDRGAAEWAAPVAVRPLNAPIPGANAPLRVGDRLEVLDKDLYGKVYLSQATVIELTTLGLIVHCENKDFPHTDHFVRGPENRMESSVVRVLGR